MLIFARVYCKLSIWSLLNSWLDFLMKLCEHNLSQTVPFQYQHLFQRTSQHSFVISNSISTTAASWLKSHKFSTWKLHSSCILTFSLWLLNCCRDLMISFLWFLSPGGLIFKWFYFSIWAWVRPVCLVFVN